MKDKHQVIDQMGREVNIPLFPKRIVSLVPSQTELLYELGVDDRLVGITKFCVHPAVARKSKTIVGGTKKFRFDEIDRLNPDLIIGNKEENYLEGISRLEKQYPVWMSDIFNLEDALSMIGAVGQIVGKAEVSDSICNQINQDLSDTPRPAKGKAVYLIWKDPYMAAGFDTFINEMMKAAGFENAVTANRYPELDLVEIEKLNPRHILLSSEPYPFKEKHITALKSRFPKADIRLVDGEIFSWYGSRLLKAKAYFDQL